MKLILSICLLIGFVSESLSQHNIRGKVIDKEDQLPLTGAYIQIEGTKIYAISDLDGTFLLKNVPEGSYKIKVSYVSYQTEERSVSIKGPIVLNFSLISSSMEFEGVTIRGKRVEDTESSARATEKLTMKVLNVISGREIDLSPDLTVANVVQRVSGVSLERNNNGDGQYAIVRGMDKRYNYTLVNGIKIPSPEAKNRYVPLDIFPSDLMDRLEVSKALTPNMEGDAIGGVIDMKMKQAPAEFVLNVNIGYGFNQLFNSRPFRSFDFAGVNPMSPREEFGNDHRAVVNDFDRENMVMKDREGRLNGLGFGAPVNQIYGLSLGNRSANGRFGILVAGSYQHTFRGANSYLMTTFVDQESNTPYYEIMQKREFSVEQIRAGAHTRMDYRIAKNHIINLYAGIINLTDREVRYRVDTIMKIGRGQGPGTGRVELRERSRQTFRKVYNSTLQGQHEFGDLKLDWSAVYSLATLNDPDMVELQWLTGVRKTNDGEILVEPVIYNRDFNRRWTSNSDQDLAGYLNLTYPVKISNIPIDLSAGGMYRHKDRENFYDNYLFRTAPINQEWSGNVSDYSFNLFNTLGTPTDPLNYTCYENVLAGYGMAKADIGKLEVLGGARYEQTSFGWETSAPRTVKGRIGSINYFDILPSVHFKYKPTEKQNWRFSYFSSISRPNFYEVIPYEINEEDFRERGNPNLRRTKANNLDLRYEWFFSPLDKVMGGVFFKRIEDPIESSLIIEGQTIFLQPNNFGTAYNYGFEFDFVKYKGKFGLRTFYTFTNSQITTSKIVRFRDENGTLTSRNEDQTRPLQGQSRHISNVSLLYKNTKTGTDAQIALVYTGSRIISVSPYLDNDVWQRAFVQMDISAEQKLKKSFVIYAKINNVLNTPFLADILLPNTFNPEQAPYIDASESVRVREDFYSQVFLLGVKYKFNEKQKQKNKS